VLSRTWSHANFAEYWLRGFGVARGRILAHSTDLLRRLYNTVWNTPVQSPGGLTWRVYFILYIYYIFLQSAPALAWRFLYTDVCWYRHDERAGNPHKKGGANQGTDSEKVQKYTIYSIQYTWGQPARWSYCKISRALYWCFSVYRWPGKHGLSR